MNYMKVDSFGTCLHNSEFPPGAISRQNKIKLIGEYKFVLTFENANVTDFVTEKIFEAFVAGTVPVFMGAPNVGDWAPRADAVIKTSDFKRPQDLATHLLDLSSDEKKYRQHFKWKADGLSKQFTQRVKMCATESACRICDHIAKYSGHEQAVLKAKTLAQSGSDSTALRLNGKGDHVKINDDPKLRLSAKYTIGLWIRPESFGDQRLVDKNKAGTVTGFNLDIQASEQNTRGYLRLCASEGCYMSKKAIHLDIWTHVCVVFSSENPSLFDNFLRLYINGQMDSEYTIFEPTKQEPLPLNFGKPSSVEMTDGTFHGQMDSLYIFDRDLDHNEVRQLLFRIPTGKEDRLVGFWGFDEQSDTKVTDSGPNGFHGTLKGGARMPSQEKPLVLNKCM